MKLLFARIKAFFAGFKARRALKAVIEAPAQALVAVAAAPAEAAKAAIVATAPVVKSFKADCYVGAGYDRSAVSSFRQAEAQYGEAARKAVGEYASRNSSYGSGLHIPEGWGK